MYRMVDVMGMGFYVGVYYIFGVQYVVLGYNLNENYLSLNMGFGGGLGYLINMIVGIDQFYGLGFYVVIGMYDG